MRSVVVFQQELMMVSASELGIKKNYSMVVEPGALT
jgi:hypothetical protein